MLPSTYRHPVAAAVAALLCAAVLPARADVAATLYPGPGLHYVNVGPNAYIPVGAVSPWVPYGLPNSQFGGSAMAGAIGIGTEIVSTLQASLGQRGVVMTPQGHYQLDPLNVNTAGGNTPVGYSNDEALAVNASGLVVGQSSLYSADGTQDLGARAVYYAPGSSKAIQLQLPSTGFTDPNGAGISGATAVASSGMIAGFANPYVGASSTGAKAVRWTSAQSNAQILDSLPGISQFGSNNAYAMAINNRGTVIGSGNTFSSSGAFQGNSAIRWNAGTTAATALGHLGTASDGTYQSAAIALNNAGTTVGYSSKYDAAHTYVGDEAVRWNANATTPVELGSLGTSSDGLSISYAMAINQRGDVIGVSEKYDGQGTDLGERAVSWKGGATAPTELGLLSQGADGASYSYAYGMNDQGYAVGVANILGTASNSFSSLAGLAVHAVVWSPDGTAIDLNSLLPKDSGWTLYGAYSISDTGWVTGLGYYQPDGMSSDFAYARLFSMQIEAVPEPATASLLGVGVAALLLRRRRRA